MQLSHLQTHNHKFTISAFDHRSSLAEVLGIDVNSEEGKSQFIQVKQLFMDVFSPISSAVLTDPLYGKFTVDRKAANAGLLMSLEESGYEGGKGVVPPLLADWGVLGVKGYNAAAKLLLYFDPQEKNAEAKTDLVQRIYEETQKESVPFLLEPVLYSESDESNFKKSWKAIQQETVEIFDGLCDVLKIEFPGLYENNDQDKSRACAVISEYAGKTPWIILSRGMAFREFKEAVAISLEAGCSGFAVGRAVWQEIEQFSVAKTNNWDTSIGEIEQFMKTTGVERMQELVELVVNK